MLHTMRFADEIRDWRAELPDFPEAGKPNANELDMAAKLVCAMSGPWEQRSYADTYQQDVQELLRAKESGKKPKPAAGLVEPTNVVDLTEALQRSMRQASGRGRSGAGRRATEQPDPASLSRAELAALARELDVQGWVASSSMTSWLSPVQAVHGTGVHVQRAGGITGADIGDQRRRHHRHHAQLGRDGRELGPGNIRGTSGAERGAGYGG